ncbi:MAG: cytochrome c oxidase subunit II [bacterium]
MEKFLGLPLNASTHGGEIDNMMGLVHWLMLVLFVGWGIFFIFTLVRFRQSKSPKANYHGVKSHISTYAEAGVIIAEAILLIGFAFPIWADVMTEHPQPQEAVTIDIVAEQFAWNIHYPGKDGVFGKRDINLIDVQSNPLGIDRDDPAAKDDVTSINQLHIPVDKPVLINLSSKDVIHSFTLNEMRIKQDVIPGISIPISFQATQTGQWEIACAQLCGLGHYRMRGFFTVHTQEAFQQWLDEQSALLEDEEEVW